MPGLTAEESPWPRGAALLAERARFDRLQKPDLSIKMKGWEFLGFPFSKFGCSIALSTVALVLLEDCRGLLHSQLVAALNKLALTCPIPWLLVLPGGSWRSFVVARARCRLLALTLGHLRSLASGQLVVGSGSLGLCRAHLLCFDLRARRILLPRLQVRVRYQLLFFPKNLVRARQGALARL